MALVKRLEGRKGGVAQERATPRVVEGLLDDQYLSHALRSELARGVDTTDVVPGRNIKASAA